MGVANELTGRVSSKYSNVEYYFHLKKTNESLAQQNEQLLNQLKSNFQAPDSLTKVVIDTTIIDTVATVRKYLWRGARVVNNSVSLPDNYITIHRGERQRVIKDMGVISTPAMVAL